MEDCQHWRKQKELKETEERIERATDNVKKEYLENICNEIMELQRTERYDLM